MMSENLFVAANEKQRCKTVSTVSNNTPLELPQNLTSDTELIMTGQKLSLSNWPANSVSSLSSEVNSPSSSQEIPAFYGVLKFVTMLKKAPNLSLSLARSSQSMQSDPTVTHTTSLADHATLCSDNKPYLYVKLRVA